MTSEKLNTPLCYLVLSGSIVYAVLLCFLRCGVLHGLAEKNYNEGREGGCTMNVFKQLELTINAFCICLITIILLIPSLYFDSINIYIKGVFVNGPVAILLAIFIQLKIFYIKIRYHKDG